MTARKAITQAQVRALKPGAVVAIGWDDSSDIDIAIVNYVDRTGKTLDVQWLTLTDGPHFPEWAQVRAIADGNAYEYILACINGRRYYDILFDTADYELCDLIETTAAKVQQKLYPRSGRKGKGRVGKKAGYSKR